MTIAIVVWDDARHAQLIALRAAGKTIEQCAAELGGYESYHDGGVQSVKKKLFRLKKSGKFIQCRTNAWTEERVTLLEELYPTGSTNWIADQINQRTGSTFTRNAITGAAERRGLIIKFPKRNTDSKRRMRLHKRQPRPSDSALGSKMMFAQLPKDVHSLKEFEAKGAPKHFLGITFRDLEPNHCRYAYDVEGVTLFCGQEKLSTSSYCVACHPMCWRPAPRRATVSKADREIIIRKMIKQGSQAAA